MRIQHNIMAMNAYRNYTNNTSALSKNLEKLSSGYKINRAGDDAAGLAISEKMRAQITGLETAQKNAKDGISLVQTAEGALTEVHDMLNRMVELADQSANGTYDNEVDRANLDKELEQLKSEINRIADSSNFNGIKLLDGSLAGGGGNISGISVSSTTAVTASTSGAAIGSATGAMAKGDEVNYTVAWKDASGSHSATVTLTAKDQTTLVAADGTEYTITGSKAKGTELSAAILAELGKNSSVAGAFKITSTAGAFTFASLQAGADGAEVTALGITGDKITTGAAITGTPTKGKDSMQKLDFSSVKVVNATGATVLDAEAANANVFEVNGKKFLFASSGSVLDNLANVDSDVTVIKLAGTGYVAANDAKNVAATISRVAGIDLEVAAAADANAGIAANDVLYKGSTPLSGEGTNGLTLQIGDTSDSYNQLTVSVQDMHTASLGIADIDIGTQAGAQAAVDKIKSAINIVSSVRGDLGATQNRLDHTINNLSVMTENIQDAESTIRDTDVADEMMAYTKNNILVQSAQAMLAQANQVPQGVLQLLQ